jgi:hypothetical protein
LIRRQQGNCRLLSSKYRQGNGQTLDMTIPSRSAIPAGNRTDYHSWFGSDSHAPDSDAGGGCHRQFIRSLFYCFLARGHRWQRQRFER